MKISYSLPIYNESEIIDKQILLIKNYLEKNPTIEDYELILYNNGSIDNSVDMIKCTILILF